VADNEVSADDCIHELPAFACSICLGRSAPKSASRAFPARYRGWCEWCRGRIEEGDMIVAKDDAYVHLHCT
jgi:hypothetical protein